MKKVNTKILVFGMIMTFAMSLMAYAADGTKIPNSITVKKVTMTIGQAKRAPVVGDRTKDNVAKVKGSYFADGSKTLKCSDYEYIIIPVKVQNKSNMARTFSPDNSYKSDYGFHAIMMDGYELNVEAGDELCKQTPSNYSFKSEIKVLHKKSIVLKKLTLSYMFVDCGKTFSDMVSEAFTVGNDKKLQEKLVKKYPEYFAKPVKFIVNVK